MTAIIAKIYVLILALMLVGATSCVSSSEYDRLQAQYDSIAQVNQQYERDFETTDSVLHEMMSFFGDFNQLSYLISINDAGTQSYRTAQKRIEENVQDMTDRLLRSQQSIDSLTQSLNSNSQKNERLEKLLARFRLAVNTQKEQLATTQQISMEQVGRMASLQSATLKLRREVNALNQAKAESADQWAEDKARLLEDMYRVRFCIGSARDLKDLGVMKGKSVNISQANFDYFTESDARLMHDLELLSNKAQLHSIHPVNSYELVKDEKGMLKLVIKDRTSFWAYSRTLIVEVD